MSSADEWSRAFARQAKADLAARETLQDNSRLPRCEELHCLQMAVEKLAKAYQLAAGTIGPNEVRRSHAYAEKALPGLYREAMRARGARGVRRWEMEAVRRLARQMDLLHPAVDDGGARPDNTEYPWEDGSGAVQTPAEWKFDGLSALYGRSIGTKLMKVLQVCADDLADGT